MKKLLIFLISFICTLIYAVPINWSIAMTSFPSDQSISDTGQEKTSSGYVDLMSGNLVFDIPEVTLKGDRGLNLTLSRSYGKVNNGFRSMGNWELESPRLVMMTGASTKLVGDYDGQGICQNNGDYANKINNGIPTFETSIIDSGYKNEITSTYVELTNANYLKKIAYALSISTLAQKSVDKNNVQNIDLSRKINNGINDATNNVAKVSSDFDKFTEGLLSVNNNDYINVLIAHLNVSIYMYRFAFVENSNISRVDIKYPNKTISISREGRTVDEFVIELIKNFNSDLLGNNNVGLIFYNKYNKQVPLLSVSGAPVDIMPVVNTNAYVNTLLALIQLEWDGEKAVSVPDEKKWSYKSVTNSISTFPLYSNVDTRKRAISLYLPGQKNITFYPIKNGIIGYPSSTRYISQDNWIISCENSGNDFKVRAPNGVSYSFPNENRENQTGFPTIFAGEYIPGRVSIYASKVENQYGESYLFFYKKLINSNKTYTDYNDSIKMFLKSVKHQLDGRDLSPNDDIKLNYSKYNGGIITDNENEFQKFSGDIVLTSIQRYINNKYVAWKAYSYYKGITTKYPNNDLSPTSTKTIAQIQDEQSGTVYLRSAGDITGDAVSYDYGGPYRILGNHTKSNNGITAQGYIWFYSDLTGVKYFKASSNGLLNVKSAYWTYYLFDFSRPGYAESKSYRVNYSDYTGIDVNRYLINYTYSRDDNKHEQTTTVKVSDPDTNLSKSTAYIMSAYPGGSAENSKHGLINKMITNNREEIFSWEYISIIGQMPKTSDNNIKDYDDVYLVRLGKKSVIQNGTYTTSYDLFDKYGNPELIRSTGMRGTESISLPDTFVKYFNSDFSNSAVNDGTLPWLVGLPTKKDAGGYVTQLISYDNQGAVISENKEGSVTKYKYATNSFSNCLGNLADFEWSKFGNCFSNYVGDRHIGLVIEKDVGGGKELTNYSGYHKGIPTQIRNANGGIETNVVDDFGNIIQHKDADGVVSKSEYDDAGRLKVDTPIVGLAFTTINYDGLNITRTLNNGGTSYTKLEKYNGDGLLIYNEDRASNKTIVNSNKYDAFGNLVFKSNPSTGGTNTGITTTYDVFDRPVTVNDNGAVVSYCYQSCGGRNGAISLSTDAYGTTESNYLAVGDFSTNLTLAVTRKGNDGTSFRTTTDYNLALLKPTSAVSGNSNQSYTYNTNGTLATERDNNVSGQKMYIYDTAGRIVSVTHQDGSIESITYFPINNLIATRSWRGVSTNYGYTSAGRLSSNTNGTTSQNYTRDGYGRIKSFTQTVNTNNVNNTYTANYEYNNLNQVVYIRYPNGKTVSFSNQNIFGEVYAIPNVIQALNYNALHQLTTVQANPNTFWTYSYTNNGLPTNVTATSLNKCALNISYGFDAINRINKLTDNCGAVYNVGINRYGTGLMSTVELDQARYTYSYNNDDITGVNIVSKSQYVTPAIYTYNYMAGTSKLSNVNGSPYKFSYDAMGNVTHDGVRALVYDAYYRISKNGNESYIYNSDGLRVRAIRDDGITDYVYDLEGNLLYDINQKTGYSKAYVYVANKLVATLERYPDTNSKGFDNMSDFEAAEFGVNSLLESYTDSDGDGLPDYLERFIGSDPNNPDTDGDGFKDGYEYKVFGVKGVLDKNLHPNEPDPDEDMAAWLPPILDMILDDDN